MFLSLALSSTVKIISIRREKERERKREPRMRWEKYLPEREREMDMEMRGKKHLKLSFAALSRKSLAVTTTTRSSFVRWYFRREKVRKPDFYGSRPQIKAKGLSGHFSLTAKLQRLLWMRWRMALKRANLLSTVFRTSRIPTPWTYLYTHVVYSSRMDRSWVVLRRITQGMFPPSKLVGRRWSSGGGDNEKVVKSSEWRRRRKKESKNPPFEREAPK